MKVIFIAGPFRGQNAWIIESNIRRAEEIALEVLLLPEQGNQPIPSLPGLRLRIIEAGFLHTAAAR